VSEPRGRQRQVLLLAALVVVLAAVLVWRFRESGPAERATAPSNLARTPGAPASSGQGEVSDVRLELLQADQSGPDDPRRNPFRFEARTRPPGPPGASVPREQPDPDFTLPPAPFEPAGPPPPPPIPLRFIGVIGAAGTGQIAAFTDGRGNNFQGREGDIIEGRYQVLRIEPESVELAYLDGRGRQTIRLSGL